MTTPAAYLPLDERSSLLLALAGAAPPAAPAKGAAAGKAAAGKAAAGKAGGKKKKEKAPAVAMEAALPLAELLGSTNFPRDKVPDPTASFYITTAINYANGAPHMGHAYEALVTDVVARRGGRAVRAFVTLFSPRRAARRDSSGKGVAAPPRLPRGNSVSRRRIVLGAGKAARSRRRRIKAPEVRGRGGGAGSRSLEA